MDVYLNLEDEYGYGLRIDKKHCAADEVRIMVDGNEMYATPAMRWKIIRTLVDSLESQ